MSSNKNNTIFSFDVGIGSLGIAVRQGNEIVHAESLLIDKNIGLLADERERRRGYRTRMAHKNREESLRKLWEKIGEKPLVTGHYKRDGKKWVWQAGDEQMHREFPDSNDETVYTSCLLRIMLLEGNQTLERWQIYKALHSAIQRRGYDSDVPWKTGGGQTDATKNDEAEEADRASEFEKSLAGISENPKHHYPCYYDAYQMKMWTPEEGIIRHRISIKKGEKADRARKYTAPRQMVDSELRSLLKQAGEYLPKLAEYLDSGDRIDELLYGEDMRANPLSQERRYPSAKQTDGLLAQKLPRFDNRCIGKCSIIPRLNVCRKKDGNFIRFNFLLGLNNLRYEKVTPNGEILTCALEVGDIKGIYCQKGKEWQDKKNKLTLDGKDGDIIAEERAKVFRLTKPKLKGLIEGQLIGGKIKVGHEEVKAPEANKLNGRCRYSRPALIIMRELILSGKHPKEFRQELLDRLVKVEGKNGRVEKGFGDHWLQFEDYKFRLYRDELAFLSDGMVDANGRLYVPQLTVADKYREDDESVENQQNAIRLLISSCHSPMIRHRLSKFHRELEKLIDKYGEPSHVCMEFIREDFMGEKRKKKYEKQANDGKKERQDTIEELKEIYKLEKSPSEKLVLMRRLMKSQKNRCPYTGKALCQDKLNSGDYEIDHIFPEELGGPDALYNKVLTLRSVNINEKQKRLPVEWMEGIVKYWGSWQKYEAHIRSIIDDNDKKKRALLLATSLEEAKELAHKYTGLAATGWIARLARDIICLRMGWTPGAKGESRNITVISGGLTNKVARKYRIYGCINENDSLIKNRGDRRHHALDAMIISYLSEWARDGEKTKFFKFPEGVDKDYFGEKLDKVDPQLIARQKARISEQPMARVARRERGKTVYKMVQRDTKLGERKVVGNYDPKIYSNLRKDKKAGGGHWYTSKSSSSEGTRTHGCLFVYPDNDDPFYLSLHAFTSPHQTRLFYTKKGYRAKQVYTGGLIYVENPRGVTATQLGGKVTLNPGTYIIKKALTSDYDISPAETSPDSESIKYRVSKEHIHKMQSGRAVAELIKRGGGREFNGFEYERGKILQAGVYRFAGSDDYREKVDLQNEDSNEVTSVEYKKLFSHLMKTTPTPELALGDAISIPKRGSGKSKMEIEANVEDKQNCRLPDGVFSIKSFMGGMKQMTIEDNHGIQYRLGTQTLMRVICWARTSDIR